MTGRVPGGVVGWRWRVRWSGGDCTVGVSWNNFQQPRWAAKDKPNMQETVEAGGGTFTDADANLDSDAAADRRRDPHQPGR